MGEGTITLGQAIDKIIEALSSLDSEARRTAVEAACSHMGVPLRSSPAQPAGPAAAAAAAIQPPAAPAAPSVLQDIRSLKEEKQPTSATQMACIVAYYLQELAPTAERSETIKTADLETYFKQAGYKLPRKMDQVLVDAKRSGYFESVARGEYRLNTVGYNLVVHNLPKHKAG